MINNLKRIIGLTIIPTIFLTYGILALNGIEISKKVKFDDAWMYIYMAIVLYILGIDAYIGQIIIDHKP